MAIRVLEIMYPNGPKSIGTCFAQLTRLWRPRVSRDASTYQREARHR
jgi:hypothetical protein